MLRKKIAAFTVTALVFALAACSLGKAPEPTPEPDEREYAYAYAKYAPDTVVMEINGQPVLWSEYFYWLMDAKAYFEYNYGAVTDFSEILYETVTIADFMAGMAEDNLRWAVGLESGQREAGVLPSEEDELAAQELWEEQVLYAGGEEELLALMDSLFLSREYFDKLNRISIMYPKGFEQIYGANAEKLSDEDAMAYAENVGYMQAQHILLKTVDDSYQPLDGEIIAQKAALANDLLAMINGAEDKNAKFKELRGEYDEDSGQVLYADGYCFTSGAMVPEFEDAVLALEDGGVSAVIETMYGYHIIMRMPLGPDSVVNINLNTGNIYTLRYSAAYELYMDQVQRWIDGAMVEYSPEFQDLDLTTVF